jgi:signal peptidase I
MTNTGAEVSPPREKNTGWGWLVAAALSRGYLLFVLALAACALLPMVTGLTGSVVQSGSMQPSIDPGDVVLARAMPDDAEVPLGRVVTFMAPEGSARTGITLHRVVAIDTDGSLVTAGDANANPDSVAISLDDIIARACLLVPFLGLPALWLGNGSFLLFGLWALLTAAALFVEAKRVLAAPRRHRESTPRPDRDENDVSRLSAGVLAKAAAGPLAVMLAMLLGSAVLVGPAFGQVNAGYTGRTTSVGNSWSMAAANPAVKLAFTAQPSSSTGGVAFASQPRVVFHDSLGRVTTSGGPVTLELTNAAGATLSCASNPVQAVSGIASFAGCSINRIGTYSLTARSGALTAAVSTNVVISRGPAVKLGFTTSPSASTVFNTSFASQPVVAVQDAGGNTVTTAAASVTLSLNSAAGAALSCTANPRSTSSGAATFSSCKVTKPGTYTLAAATSGLTAATSASFTIISGPATKLAFSTSPSSAVSTTAFATQPVVTVQDASGNTVSASTTAVVLSITTPAGATLGCASNTLNAVTGVARFSGCNVDKAGTYTLRASSGALSPATSTTFTITRGAATKLAFTASPGNSVSATAFTTQPVVAIQDAGGNTISSTAAVALTLTDPAGATMVCATNPRAAVSGVATFSGCRVDKAGSYTLTARSGSLTQAVSTTFTVAAGSAARVVFLTSPSSSAANSVFLAQPVVAVQDASGNPVTSSHAVTLFIAGFPFWADLSCSANPRTTVAGVATFSGCRINWRGEYSLSAAINGLPVATSSSFTID